MGSVARSTGYMVLQRPVEPAPLLVMWEPFADKPVGLGAFDLGRRLSSWRFAERIHRNRRVLDLDDLEMFRLRWRAQVHAVAGARLHQRIGERRAPADVAAVEVHLVDADDRDDVFEAGGVLVGHGCAEEDARGG